MISTNLENRLVPTPTEQEARGQVESLLEELENLVCSAKGYQNGFFKRLIRPTNQGETSQGDDCASCEPDSLRIRLGKVNCDLADLIKSQSYLDEFLSGTLGNKLPL